MPSLMYNISGFSAFGGTTNYKDSRIRRLLLSINNAKKKNIERLQNINHQLIKNKSQRPSLRAYCLFCFVFNNMIVYLV